MAPLDNYASSRFTPHLSGSSRHHLRSVRQSRLSYCGGVAGQVGIRRVSAANAAPTPAVYLGRILNATLPVQRTIYIYIYIYIDR